MPKTILVTGSSSGIGLALRNLLLEGTDNTVYGLDVQPSPDGHELKRYRHRICDLRDPEAVKNAILESGLLSEKVNAVVNCAGVMPTAPISKLEPEIILDAFTVNCVAPLYLARLLLKPMIRAKDASFVMVTSIAADLNIPGEVVYGATKAALKHIGEAMSVELGRFGIRVNCIAPVLVETPLTAHLGPGQREYMRSKQASQAPVTAGDVASAIAYLLDAPSTITSSTLYIGGLAK